MVSRNWICWISKAMIKLLRDRGHLGSRIIQRCRSLRGQGLFKVRGHSIFHFRTYSETGPPKCYRDDNIIL